MELYGETFDEFCLRMSALTAAIKDPLFEFESALEMYIFAKENLEEATLNHAFEIREAYADIRHTHGLFMIHCKKKCTLRALTLKITQLISSTEKKAIRRKKLPCCTI
ncbi:hypothetical protein ABE021_10125 [Sporosarcina gallistercoris]|uniref:hypothetical protein n=1 Tax=Sporosarcina gallistercoris TaxID=2762245 RepID=UPI003D2B7CB9